MPTVVVFTSNPPAPGARPPPRRTRPRASARARRGAVPDGDRAPASRSAQIAARAVPPAPSTSARHPGRRRRRSRRCSPGASVLSACDRAVGGEAQRVRGADRARRLAGLVGERERGVLVRHGDVGADEAGAARARATVSSNSPAAPAAAGRASRCSPQRGERRALHRRRAAVGDRPAEHAEARGSRAASARGRRSRRARRCRRRRRLELRVGRSRTRARRRRRPVDVVEVGDVRRVRPRRHRRQARVGDRRRRQARVQARVVRRVQAQLRLGQRRRSQSLRR